MRNDLGPHLGAVIRRLDQLLRLDQRRWLVPHVHAYPEPRLLWLLQHTRDSQLLPGAKEGGCEQAYLVSAEPLRPEGVVRRPGTDRAQLLPRAA